MNIFFIDRDPNNITKWAVDSHVNKMAFESAQMLSACHNDGRGYIYPVSVLSHPCTLWAKSNREHYTWLYVLMLSYMAEYTARYKRNHFLCGRISDSLADHPTYMDSLIPSWRDPPQAMPDVYKHKDTVQAYRRYYKYGKLHLHRWTPPGIKPDWI